MDGSNVHLVCCIRTRKRTQNIRRKFDFSGIALKAPGVCLCTTFDEFLSEFTHCIQILRYCTQFSTKNNKKRRGSNRRPRCKCVTQRLVPSLPSWKDGREVICCRRWPLSWGRNQHICWGIVEERNSSLSNTCLLGNVRQLFVRDGEVRMMSQ